MPMIDLSSKEVVPSEGGDYLALGNDYLAVGSAARLNIWQGERRRLTVEAPSPAPGLPRFVGERVYWGPGSVDLSSGQYRVLKDAQPGVFAGSGERPQVYAWSPGGDRLLGSFSTGKRTHPVRITLFCGQTGTPLATLYEGGGLAPQVAWLSATAVVVGFGDPEVFNYSGERVANLALQGSTLISLTATLDERHLLAVDLNRFIAWIDTQTWTVRDRWLGPWLQGAVSPDGRFCVGLTERGKLHFACLDNDCFRPIGEVDWAPDTNAIALSSHQIATAGGGAVHFANLKVDCS